VLATLSWQFTAQSAALPDTPTTPSALLRAGQQAVAVIVAELNRVVVPVLAAGDTSAAGRAG
jgi:hypothetical protein